MKQFFKRLFSILSQIIVIPLTFIATVCLTWYVLPKFQATTLGQFILTTLGSHLTVFILTIVCVVLLVLFMVLARILRPTNTNSKVLNFYTHFLTWTTAIILFIEAGYTFIMSDSFSSVEFEITLVRKIGLAVGVIALFLYSLIAPKVRVVVNRRIQAYDTAKELNANGRSSVVFMNILKALDFICPELIVLIMLCFACSFEVSLYFIFVICSFILPIIGNMICDKRVKIEAVRKEQLKQEELISATASAVVAAMETDKGEAV